MGNALTSVTQACCTTYVSPSIIMWPMEKIEALAAATPEPEGSPKKIVEQEAHDGDKTIAADLCPVIEQAKDLLGSSGSFKISIEGSRGNVYNILNVSDGVFAVVKGHSAPNCGSPEMQDKYCVCASSQSEKLSSNETIRWRHCINRQTHDRCLVKISDRREVFNEEQKINLTLRTHNPVNHFLLPYLDIYHDKDCTYEIYETPKDVDDDMLPRFLKLKEEIPEQEAANIIYHLLIAVKQLASLYIVYRNIQAEDICLFGKHYYVTNLSSCVIGEQVAPIGNPAMWPKEVFETRRYTAKSVVYNIGLLAWLLIHGTHPFYQQNMSFEEIEEAAGEKRWIRNTTPTLFMDRELREFFTLCCLPEEEMDYACFDVLLEHDWIASGNSPGLPPRVF
eukprot:GEMP01005930.1.p1 GENE.GEMP01005930.1~~GEMP01005930.1.p1  ORF type:complete len:393 (+),score=67.22 GEMP01005930.1:201-1379(+)